MIHYFNADHPDISPDIIEWIEQVKAIHYEDPPEGLVHILRMLMWSGITAGALFFTHSPDVAAQWRQQQVERPDSLQDIIRGIHFFDAQNGWAVGRAVGRHGSAYSVTYNTTNGGDQWRLRSVLHDTIFTDITGFGDFGIMVGWRQIDDGPYTNRGYIRTTRDGGRNWEDALDWKPSDGKVELLSAHCITDSIAFAVGVLTLEEYDDNVAVIVRTTDQGANWDATYSIAAWVFKDVYFIDRNTGWAIGSQAGVWRTIDGGDSWTRHGFDIHPPHFHHESVSFSDIDHGWIAGDSEIYIHTTDGGATWHESSIDAPHPPRLNAIAFADRLHGWTVGSFAAIYHTTDGGATWQGQTETDGLSQSLYTIHVRNQDGIWVGGEDGVIMHNDDVGVVDVSQASEPNERIAIAGISPHPATDYVTIDYVIDRPGQCKITLIDARGKTALTHWKESVLSGPQRLTLNISALSAGSFTLQLDMHGAQAQISLIKVR